MELELFKSDVIDSVKSGKDYARTKEGLSCINVAITCLIFDECFSSTNCQFNLRLSKLIAINYES